MSAKTPVRVRGKRSAIASEKWNHGKRQKSSRSATLSTRSTSTFSDSAVTESSPPRKRRQRNAELSMLEQLPTEVIQLIFVYSTNIELPQASPILASQLKSRHLYHELTNKLLHLASDAEPRDKMRLMNCKFFTWEFFKDWMKSKMPPPGNDSESGKGPFCKDANAGMNIAQAVLPPVKLLRPPFTPDKVNMLCALANRYHDGPRSCTADPVYLEAGKEALSAAVVLDIIELLPPLRKIGIQPEAEHLRRAVVEGPCNQEVVKELISSFRRDSYGRGTDVDFLDPTLWAWAKEAQTKGDAKGDWLMDVLRRANAYEKQRLTPWDYYAKHSSD